MLHSSSVRAGSVFNREWDDESRSTRCRSSRCLVAFAVFCGLRALGSGAASWGADVEQAVDASKRGGTTKLALIDQRLKEMWEQSSIKPSPVCSEEEFLRRAYLDIAGRIPTIKEAAGYLQTKESGKRQKLVEYLLNQPDFAKNFANQWAVLLIGRKTRDRDVEPGCALGVAAAAVQRRSALERGGL